MKVLKRALLGVLAIFLVVLISAGAAIYLTKPFASPVEIETTSSDSRIITAIEKQEQIVLMSASVQGISTERVDGTIWGADSSRRLTDTVSAVQLSGEVGNRR